ncbi:MAG: ATP-binding protein [Geopsychrobacter sp.]|nr:ATP-binding protein [Geopsychrobacter sp.]
MEKCLGELDPLLCHPQQINQVFLNILINAAQAIEKKGIIRVRTWQDEENQYVEIRDDGSGIPADIRQKIFEPFFTTKDVGKGTGLGMSISYEIIKSHGGRIELESELGVGTTFTIVLPREGVATEAEACDV